MRTNGKKSRAPLVISILALVLILAIGTVVVRVRQLRAAVSYDSHAAQSGTIVRTVSGTGRVVATQKQTFFATSGGQVGEILFALGDSVSEGEPVLRTVQGTEVVASFDGEVTALNVNENEWFNPGARLFEITNYDSLEIAASVDELDVAKINEGQMAKIYINALPDDIRHGNITAIAREGVLSGGIMTFAVRVSISDRSRLLIGMSAEVKVETSRAENVLVIPMKTVNYVDNSPYVLLRVTERENRRQPVELGISDGINVEVKQGLNVGDVVLSVITSPTPTRPFFGSR